MNTAQTVLPLVSLVPLVYTIFKVNKPFGKDKGDYMITGRQHECLFKNSRMHNTPAFVHEVG